MTDVHQAQRVPDCRRWRKQDGSEVAQILAEIPSFMGCRTHFLAAGASFHTET